MKLSGTTHIGMLKPWAVMTSGQQF